jgi:hypothetical protein
LSKFSYRCHQAESSHQAFKGIPAGSVRTAFGRFFDVISEWVLTTPETRKQSIENLFDLIFDGPLSTKWAGERIFLAGYATSGSASDDRVSAFSKLWIEAWGIRVATI